MTSPRVKLGAAFAAGAGCLGAIWFTAGAVLCESALRPRRASGDSGPPKSARCQTVEISGGDGTRLLAWFLTPATPNGRYVVILHGVGDSRRGELGLARMMLKNHYTVLIPDSRAHGESSGDIVTYGIRETSDLRAWVDWLVQTKDAKALFALGESLGAGVVLQSLSQESRFRAVVAECPFASFRRIAEERVAQRMSFQPLARPLVWCAFSYARWKYDLDFDQASPELSIAGSTTPVLLIHGLADGEIVPGHSLDLFARNPGNVELWLVPGAGHSSASSAAPAEFERRVLAWYDAHA